MEFLDELHRQCAGEQMVIRRMAEAFRASASVWEPRPCPPRPGTEIRVVVGRLPYLDEVTRPRSWIRS